MQLVGLPALTLAGPTRHKPVLDPLDLKKNLECRLYLFPVTRQSHPYMLS